MSTEVQLAIYDLSQGMARTMSAQFLGPQHVIDIIPHTGVIVYGLEFFYGGGGPGIAAEHPIQFRTARGIQPIRIETLGQTTVSKHEFQAWCQRMMQTGRYHGSSYDLLQNNCNNFSHDAAREGLRLPRGVPEWILGVPQQFLSSPLGQMARPLLENMQVSGGGAVPFVPQSMTAPVLQTDVDPSYNPWANSSASLATTLATEPARPNNSDKPSTIETPTLDSFIRPLLSNDTKTVTLCAKKLVSSSENDGDKAALEEMALVLSSSKTKPNVEQIEKASKAIFNQLENVSKNLAFALMYLRLLVLHSSTPSLVKCIKWVQAQLKMQADESVLKTPASRSMAWCTLSNAYGSSHSLDELDSVCAVAMSELVLESQPRVQVRQAAVALLYNVALANQDQAANGKDLSDLIVSLLCGSLDDLAAETDTTTQLRRLLVAARIVKNKDGEIRQAAKSLVVDLGFIDVLRQVASMEASSPDDGKTTSMLAQELIKLLKN